MRQGFRQLPYNEKFDDIYRQYGYSVEDLKAHKGKFEKYSKNLQLEVYVCPYLLGKTSKREYREIIEDLNKLSSEF